MSETWQSEGIDEVEGAPCEGKASHLNRNSRLIGNMKEQNQYDSLLDSGLGSLGSNASLSLPEGMARLEIAEKAHQRHICLSITEEGYQSLDSESLDQLSPGKLELVLKDEGSEEQTKAEEHYILFQQDQDGDTKLHIAIAKCIAPVAKRIIDLAPTIEDLNRINSQKLSPLHMAVLTNQPELTRYLLLRGAMLEIRDEDGNTPLHLACALGHHACILALTESLTGSESVISGSIPFQQIPQDMDIKNYDGYTCMHLAAQQCHLGVLTYLYGPSVRADVNARDGLSGRTVLHHAADAGHLQLATFMVVQYGADANARAYSGCTPLQLAAGRNHQPVTRLLLGAGAHQPNPDSSSDSDLSSEDDMMDSFDDFQINSQSTTASLCR